MDNQTNQQLAQMTSEIQSIKNILYQKKPHLRAVLHPKHLKLFMLLTGISISVLSLVFYYLEQRYGGFSTSPDLIRNAYGGLAMLVGISLFGLLFVFWSRSLKKNEGKLTGEHVWSAFFSFRVFHLMFPVDLLALLLIIYCIDQDMAYYIIPILSIHIGLQFNFMGCITETKNYVIGGYWYMTAGVIIFLSNSIAGSLAVLLSLGCGSLLFGLLPNPEK